MAACMRVERIGNSTLYQGHCLEVLSSIKGVDHTITDPPYEEEAHTKNRRTLGRGDVSHREVINENLPFLKIDDSLRAQVSQYCQLITKGWGLYFCQAEAVSKWKESLEAADAKYKRACIWVKPDGMPQFTGDRPAMGYESIVAVWHGEGKSAWNGGGKHGVYVFTKHDKGYGHGGINNGHPTTKPQDLMLQLVNDFTNKEDVILDPFMGSGSTGVACMNLGRKFIGIELEEKYFDIACERIEQSQKQQRLFA